MNQGTQAVGTSTPNKRQSGTSQRPVSWLVPSKWERNFTGT